MQQNNKNKKNPNGIKNNRLKEQSTKPRTGNLTWKFYA